MKSEVYATKDLPESAFLLANNVTLETIDVVGRTCWFTFANKSHCTSLVDSFWMKNALVPALKYFTALQTLKSRIFAAQSKVKDHENQRA